MIIVQNVKLKLGIKKKRKENDTLAQLLQFLLELCIVFMLLTNTLEFQSQLLFQGFISLLVHLTIILHGKRGRGRSSRRERRRSVDRIDGRGSSRDIVQVHPAGGLIGGGRGEHAWGRGGDGREPRLRGIIYIIGKVDLLMLLVLVLLLLMVGYLGRGWGVVMRIHWGHG